jgi:hypothetical protein
MKPWVSVWHLARVAGPCDRCGKLIRCGAEYFGAPNGTHICVACAGVKGAVPGQFDGLPGTAIADATAGEARTGSIA